LWALAEEPGVAHVVGRSRDVALIFFEDALKLRLYEESALKPISESSGFIGDIKAKTFHAAGGQPAPTATTAWLLTERVARAWEAMVNERPFDP
jgi:hypothetical protein